MSTNIKQIDFLPDRYRQVDVQRHSKWWRMLVLVLFGGAICATQVGQMCQRRQVQAQLDDATLHYQAAQLESQKLANIRQTLVPLRAKAELLTYLRHPWPRSQLLASIAAPLPNDVLLERVRFQREQIRTEPTVAAPPPQPGVAAADMRTPVERDLEKVRDEADQSRIVIYLEGTTRDDASLHNYLSLLTREPLLAENELASLERDQAHLRFTVRVLVRPGYGQRRGPAGPRPAESTVGALSPLTPNP
ncbi:MAG: hypothetical protein JSS27_13340 [Planctomycetes bacterium]|nr:hypothetical protein [Planctomycetota bacterium]